MYNDNTEAAPQLSQLTQNGMQKRPWEMPAMGGAGGQLPSMGSGGIGALPSSGGPSAPVDTQPQDTMEQAAPAGLEQPDQGALLRALLASNTAQPGVSAAPAEAYNGIGAGLMPQVAPGASAGSWLSHLIGR